MSEKPNARQLRVCMQQFTLARKAANATYMMCEDNRAVWYCMINPAVEPVNGSYLVRIEITQDYPMTSPNFYVLTPNGVLNTDKICLDNCIADIHVMINTLISMLIVNDTPIAPTTRQAELAAESRLYNETNYPRECAVMGLM